MRKIIVMGLIVFFMIAACDQIDEKKPTEDIVNNSHSDNQLEENIDALNNPVDLQANILSVSTDLEYKNNWYIVPEDVHAITISVEAENVETILFWIAPTGTETGREKELIGYDNDGTDGWSITWDFGDRIFHDHISIQALGSDYVTQASETINVHTWDESMGE